MFRRLTVVWVLMVAGGVALPAAAQLHVKVHKELITLSAPDKNGIVSVLGNNGSVTSSSVPTSFYVENIVSQVRVPVTLRPDGGFSTRIMAEAGQQVRILARIAGGKQSYGTLTVPQAPGGAAVPAEPAGGNPPPIATGGPANLADTGETLLPVILPVDPNNPLPPDLTVIITIINPQTGQVLAVRGMSAHTGLMAGTDTPLANSSATVAGKSANGPPAPHPVISQRVTRIIQACLNAIRDELAPGQASRHGSSAPSSAPPDAAGQTSSGTTKGAR